MPRKPVELTVSRYIYIGENIESLDEKSKEEQREIGLKLNLSGLTKLGYVPVEETT